MVVGLAFDHRDSLVQALADLGQHLTRAAIEELKAAIVGVLAPAASAVMIDHEYGALAIARHVIPVNVGRVMPLEAQGYAQLGDERATTLMPEFGPAEALGWGADACKLLLPMRPDRPEFTRSQLACARSAIGAAHRVSLPIVVEPLIYRLSSESISDFASSLTRLTIDAVSLVAELGPDLLKLPFPAAVGPDDAGAEPRARDACARLDRSTRGIPWTLLGGGAAPDAFAWQLGHAGAAGACGFLAGRTIWGDALTDNPVAAADLARVGGAERLARYAAIAASACRPLSA